MAKRKKLQQSKISSYFFKFLFIFGVILMLIAVTLKLNYKRNLSFASDIPPSAVAKTQAYPERILIPSVGIDLDVLETQVKENNWQINEDGASHLDTSANPGENGNIIIYAHNTKDRFGNLSELKKGEIIKVYTTNQKIYTYEVKSIKTVNPDEVELLLPTKKEVLTIYTCTGFADLKRLVIQAEPLKS